VLSGSSFTAEWSKCVLACELGGAAHNDAGGDGRCCVEAACCPRGVSQAIAQRGSPDGITDDIYFNGRKLRGHHRGLRG
jgi:hypothetical protein